MENTSFDSTIFRNSIKEIFVSVSDDCMKAMVLLTSPPEGERYTESEIRAELEAKGVKMGIDNDVIRKMLQKEEYDKSVIVAEGQEKVNGIDGVYQFAFDTKHQAKPVILEDGTVDYLNMKLFESVSEGTVVAKYTPPTKGVFGYNVKGKLLVPKPGRPLSPLRGHGFLVSEDKCTYIAAISGKIDYRNGELNISNVYEVAGNLDLSVGNIDFDGDVRINGDVLSGMSICSRGSVYVSGHIGAARIKAGGDIILNNGMQANDTGTLVAKGNIAAKFLENVRATAHGNISANYILNSELYAEGKVIVNGARGAILGGMTQAVLGVVTRDCGNEAFVPTFIRIGATREARKKYSQLLARLKEIDSDLEVLTRGVDKYTRLRQERPESVDQVVLTRITQAKILRAAERARIEEERAQLQMLIQESARAKVHVEGCLYPGVRVSVDELVYEVTDTIRAVDVSRCADEICAKRFDA